MAIFDLKGRRIRAVNDRIIVQKAVRPKKSAGGLFLPDEDVRIYCEGMVLSVGPDVKSCKVGEQIIWEVFKGQAAGHHDEERWALKDADVLGVLEDAAPAACEHSGAQLARPPGPQERPKPPPGNRVG